MENKILFINENYGAEEKEPEKIEDFIETKNDRKVMAVKVGKFILPIRFFMADDFMRFYKENKEEVERYVEGLYKGAGLEKIPEK